MIYIYFQLRTTVLFDCTTDTRTRSSTELIIDPKHIQHLKTSFISLKYLLQSGGSFLQLSLNLIKHLTVATEKNFQQSKISQKTKYKL